MAAAMVPRAGNPFRVLQRSIRAQRGSPAAEVAGEAGPARRPTWMAVDSCDFPVCNAFWSRFRPPANAGGYSVPAARSRSSGRGRAGDEPRQGRERNGGGSNAHSNTNLGFGPLGRIFVSPTYHRIHHQLDGPHDVNLGFALTTWNQMLHRAVLPTSETIRADTGLTGRPLIVEQSAPRARHLTVFTAQLVAPFRPIKGYGAGSKRCQREEPAFLAGAVGGGPSRGRTGPPAPTKSTCYGTCAVYWPPVTGSPVAGPGMNGRLGTIRRSGGATQVTYDRHPLYTYFGDPAPGQANGNDINLNCGLWYEMAASG